jgi:hypothetical protein
VDIQIANISKGFKNVAAAQMDGAAVLCADCMENHPNVSEELAEIRSFVAGAVSTFADTSVICMYAY